MHVVRKSLALAAILATATASAKVCSEDKVPFGEGTAKFEVSEYHPEGTAGKSLLIIPPTGGTNLIDRSYAEKFCARGYEVFLINDWPRPGEGTSDLEVHQRFYGNAQKAVSLVLNQVKTPFIGLLGTSVGALHASISATTLDKINAVFFIVGGLPIAEVIVTSDQEAMRDLRAVRREKFGFKTDEENISAIGPVFTLEPTAQHPLKKPQFVGAVVSKGDETVPYKTQQQLVEFFQPKTVITLNNSHFWAIVKTWLFHSSEVLNFFDDSFKLSSKPQE